MENIYLPGSSVKERQTSFGVILKLGLNAEKTIEFINANKNERGYINFDISPRKAPSDKGETHTIKLDNWQPNQAQGSAAPQQAATKAAAKPKPVAPEKEDIAPDDIPF